MYLTPAQYRAMNFGVDETDDVKLAGTLRRASADVDSFCAVPQIPQRHDFRGGTITGETHTWRLDPYDRAPRRRTYPYHTPVLVINSMRIHVTNTQYVELGAASLHYESSEGWIEPFDAALTTYGLFGAGVLPFIGLSQPYVKLDYTYGYRELVSERLYYGEGGVYRASRGYWVAAPEVRVNGTVRTTGYTADLVEGTIAFTASPPVGDDTVDVVVLSSLPYDIMEATGIVAASKLGDRSWNAKGFTGLRDVAVAEVRLTRDQARAQGSDQRLNLPAEAADKLAAYVFRTVR